MDPRSTAGLRRVSTPSIIYYEVDGDTSKYSLQSSTLYGRDQEWVLLAPAPDTGEEQVYVIS